MPSLTDELVVECNRVVELIDEYQDMPGGVDVDRVIEMGAAIHRAYKAIMTDDISSILECHNEMKEIV